MSKSFFLITAFIIVSAQSAKLLACMPEHVDLFACLGLPRSESEHTIETQYQTKKKALEAQRKNPYIATMRSRLERLYREWREGNIPSLCATKESLAAQIEKLCQTFSTSGVYLRRTARLVKDAAGFEGELDYIPHERKPSGEETYRSATVLKEGKPIAPYTSASPGLIIDPANVTLGIWAPRDLASPTKTVELIRTMVNESRRRKVWGEGEHKIPIKSTYEEVLREINAINQPVDYNEALIDYAQPDIIAMFVTIPRAANPGENGNEEIGSLNVIDAVKQAVDGWERLSHQRRELPIATYDKDTGKLSVLRSLHDFVGDVVNAYCGKDARLKLVAKLQGRRVESRMDHKSCSILEALTKESISKPNVYQSRSAQLMCPTRCTVTRR